MVHVGVVQRFRAGGCRVCQQNNPMWVVVPGGARGCWCIEVVRVGVRLMFAAKLVVVGYVAGMVPCLCLVLGGPMFGELWLTPVWHVGWRMSVLDLVFGAGRLIVCFLG